MDFNRIFSIIFASLLIILISPLLIIITAIIYLFDGKPVFYRGERIGIGGKIFTIIKFRTLSNGSEEKIGGRLLRDEENFVTRIGRVLRCLKLDEMPQLFNILKGDMNFVGPRPVRPILANEYSKTIKNYDKRFEIKPGLTGLAQLRGGYYCQPKRKTQYDLFYLKKRNMVLDLKLLFLTGYRMVFSPSCLKKGDRPLGLAKSCEEYYKKQKTAESQGVV